METQTSFADALLLEYHQLKEEQRLRINTRDNLIYYTFGLLLMTMAGLAQTDHCAVLLIFPPMSVALGWTYLINDDRVTAIARYLETSLSPRISELLCSTAPAFGWEAAHRAGRCYRARKRRQIGMDMLVFCLPALVAAIVAGALNYLPWLLLAGPEIAAVLLLAVRIIAQARSVLAETGQGAAL